MGDFSVKAVLSAVDKNFSSTMKSALGYTNDLKNTLISGMGFGALMSVGQSAVSAISNGVSDLITEIDSSNKSWKTFTSNMEMLGKSADEIQSTKQELQDFATQTIYSASDMATTFSQLEAVGTKNTTKLVKGFGGLAAAAENPAQAMKTLSVQATQMAAKPTVAWMDFKLMLEQTPAGIAAVAKEMGMTAGELVAAVQDGTVATEDFFDAIVRVGTNDSFTKLATQYKTVGEAMDGLQETISNKLQPSYEELSGVAISSIEKIIDKVGELNTGTLLSVDNLKTLAGSVGTAFAGALSVSGGIPLADAVNTVPGTLKEAAGNAKRFGSSIKEALNQNYFKRTMDELAKKSGKTVKELQSDIAKMSQKYRKSGLDASEAMKKAYEDIGYGTGTVRDKVKSAFSSMLDGPRKFADNTKSMFSNLGGIADMILPDAITRRADKLASSTGKAFGSIKKTAVDMSGFVKNALSSAFTVSTEAPIARIGANIKKASGFFSGFGKAVASNVGMGAKALGRLGEIMTTVFSTSLKAVAPGAIIGLLIAGLGILESQFGSSIDSMIQTAIIKGPGIVQGLVDGVVGKIPALMSAGSQMFVGLLNAITANLPTIMSGGAEIITTLILGLIQNLPQIIPAAVQVVTTFIRSLGEIMPQIILAGFLLISSLVSGIAQNLPQLATAAIYAITRFIQGMTENMPQILEKGVETVKNVVDGIVKGLPRIAAAGLRLLITLATALIDNLPQILSAGGKIAETLVLGIFALLSQVVDAGLKLVESVGKGLLSGLGKIGDAAMEIVNSIGDTIGGAIHAAYSWGADLVNGIASGIRNAVGAVIDAAAGVASSIAEFLHFSRPDKGPLRPYEKWMPDFMQGLAGGIKKNIGLVKSVIEEVADEMAISDIEICPTLSLSRVSGSTHVRSQLETLSDDYDYNHSAEYTILVPLEIEGREVAKATAAYTQEELTRLEKRNNRKKGKR